MNTFSFRCDPGAPESDETRLASIPWQQWEHFRRIRHFCHMNKIKKILITSYADLTDPAYSDSASQEETMDTLVREICAAESARDGLDELKVEITLLLPGDHSLRLEFDAFDYETSRRKAEKAAQLAIDHIELGSDRIMPQSFVGNVLSLRVTIEL